MPILSSLTFNILHQKSNFDEKHMVTQETTIFLHIFTKKKKEIIERATNFQNYPLITYMWLTSTININKSSNEICINQSTNLLLLKGLHKTTRIGKKKNWWEYKSWQFSSWAI